MRTQFRLILALTALISAAGLFTSCDGDISYTLEGTWEGNMFQEYYYEGTTYSPSYTEVTFLKDPYAYSSGAGYWVDYFESWIPWKNTYIANHITWVVEGGNIYIHLVEDRLDFTICDYHLSDEHFRGELIGSDGSYGRFNLRHVASPNWDDYYWGYSTRSGESHTEPALPQRITH